ncbi:MAG: hypothetical protein ABEH38_08715 [Flavobacteriales bacterium]
MSYKDVNAARNTETRDLRAIEAPSGNLFQSIVVLSKRADQINLEIKEELTEKLSEFASASDNLEEVFENREQIEISKFYERLPKPGAIAIQEMLEGKLYHYKTDEDKAQEEERLEGLVRDEEGVLRQNVS